MDEIEEFLRQAAARRGRQAQQQQQPEIQYVEPEVVEAQPVHDRELGTLSQRHLDTSEFDERPSHLGQRTARAHDHMEAHIHQRFDHQVTHLSESSPGPDDTPAYDVDDETPYVDDERGVNLAQQIANLLRAPQSIRQAIILTEILRRPDQR